MELYRKLKKKLKKKLRNILIFLGLEGSYTIAKEFLKKTELITLRIYYASTGFTRKKGIILNKNAQLLHSYKNKHLGKRCFLIGNGPSLSIQDLELIQNEITFGCNRVYKLFQNTSWRPTYFCMIDALIAKYSSEELALNIKCPLFTNFTTKKLMPVIPENVIQVRNLGDKPYRISKNFEAYYVPSGATVMTFMIELAMYMGFSEIYLLGVDCTSSLTTHGHCIEGYVDSSLVQKDIDRIRKRLNDPTLTAEQVSDYYFNQSTYSYKILYDHANKIDISILNATRGGMLDVFPRIVLEKVIN